MTNIEEGIKILLALKAGIYICWQEIDRRDYSLSRTNELCPFVFEKVCNSQYFILGSECPYNERELLQNCYREFAPLIQIEPVIPPVI